MRRYHPRPKGYPKPKGFVMPKPAKLKPSRPIKGAPLLPWSESIVSRRPAKPEQPEGKDMMDITPEVDVGEFLAWLQEEIAAEPRTFSDDDFIDMLADLKRQVATKTPAELTALIDAALQQLEREDKPKNQPARH